MIMMGIENTGQIPFRQVYLHGLIRDEKGDKMSKSRGNVVDPAHAIKRYGTDALRFALSTGNSPGNDMRVGAHKLEGSRNFTNKLWNAARYVLVSLDSANPGGSRDAMPVEDRWILSRLNNTINEVNDLLEQFQLGEALRRIYDFLWTEYCDWYIEISKVKLRQEAASNPLPVLIEVLEKSLRLLHLYMPFITEEIWQNIREKQPKGKPASIMIAQYPVADKTAIDPEAEREMQIIVDIIHSIRNARAESRADPGKFIKAVIAAGDNTSAVEAHAPVISTLARVQPLSIRKSRDDSGHDQAKVIVLRGLEVILPLEGMIDISAEKNRLEREIQEIQFEINRIERLLGDNAFREKAPPAIVDKEKRKLEERRDKLERLQERSAELR
jgi:valyl-tRNA synthetase